MVEPRRKKRCIDTNFELCLKCQTSTKELLRKSPNETSYSKFLNRTRQRADYGDVECIAIWERLDEMTVDILRDKAAVWHSTCYSSITNNIQLERAKERYDRSVAAKDAQQLKRKRGRPSAANIQSDGTESSETSTRQTRSQIPTFDRNKCFFCQRQLVDHPLHECRSNNVGEQLSTIIKNSNVAQWQVNYDVVCENDALSRDIVYHKICMTRQWKKYCIPKHEAPEENKEETVAFIAAEIQFYAQLNDSTSSGNYIPITQALTDYTNIMKDHNVTGIEMTRRTLKDKIKTNIENVEFTRPLDKSKPTLIHSTAAQDAAVIAAAHQNGIEEVRIIFQCAQIVRRAIEQANAWTFDGSLSASTGPLELDILLKWIVQGHTVAQTKLRADIIHQSCKNIAQQVILAYKSKRQVAYKPKSPMAGFRNSTETPLTTGMSLHCYHATRSKTMIDLLAHAGIGASYKSTVEHVSQIAGEVQQNIDDNNGVYVPPGLIKNQTIYAAIDNIDAKVDTPDGKDSFHALAATVFQKGAQQGSNTESLVEPLQLSARSATTKLKNVPLTGVELLPCTIMGAPKPKSSPHYPDFKVFQHVEKLVLSEQCITAWLMGRFFCRQKSGAKHIASSVDCVESSTHPSISTDTDTQFIEQTAIREGPAVVSGEHILVEVPSTSTQSTNSRPTDTDAQPQTMKQSTVMNTTTRHSAKHCVPVWAAYNSLINTKPTTDQQKPLDEVHALPLINAPAHEWPTLTTSLLQLHNLNQLVRSGGPQKPVCIWLDMDLYKRVVKLAYLDPSQYANKWIESPGQFHTVLCALRCLGQTVESSGLDEAWVQADMYSNVTVMQIMNGKHYNRAIECHQVTLQVLTDLLLDALFQKNPSAYEALQGCLENLLDACRKQKDVPQAHRELVSAIAALDFEKLINEFDAANDKYPVYKWVRMYMRQVTTLLSFLQATRQQEWTLHLASLEQLCIWFFAYNRLDYAQHVPEYLARMYNIQHTNPEVWDDFAEGNFTVKTNPITFTAIGVDQAQEHVNKGHKGDGGVCGITTNPEALLRYCLSTPELTRLSVELNDMLGVTKSSRSSHHHMTDSKVNRQELYIRDLKKVLSNCNPFTVGECGDGTELKLFNLMTKVIPPDCVAESILATESRGENAYRSFVEERICGQKNLWEKMSKVKVLGWSSACKPLKTNTALEHASLKASNSLMARLLIIARSSRELDMKDVIETYEFSNINQQLMTSDGRLHPCQDKAQLMHQLENFVALPEPTANPASGSITAQIPDRTCILFDAMAVVQELVVFKSIITNCNDLAKQCVQAIDRKSRGYMCTYVVFDDYSVQSSLKDATRKLRTKGKSKQQPSYKVEDATPIKDFATFLSSTVTKDQLTLYLAEKVIEHSTSPVTAVTRTCVLSNQKEFVEIQTSQEEADTLLILYAAEVHKLGLNIHIYSSDTDVLVLAVSTQPSLGSEATLIMGTGEKRHPVRVQPIYNALGGSKVAALRGLHAMSGCDTTGHIHGKSKNAWWSAFLTANDRVISALSELGIDEEPSETVLDGCEELVSQLYATKKATYAHARDTRWSHFLALKANQGTEKLPPTQGAIHEHIRRAHLQCSIWQQVLVARPCKLEATALGWSCESNGELMPVLSRIPVAPESLVQLVKCGCDKGQCRGRCTCRQNNVECTEFCKCASNYEKCRNVTKVTHDSDSELESETEDG